MDLVIDQDKKKMATRLMDPTALRTVIHYMDNNIQGIEFAAVVQDGFDLPEVVSPLMIHNDDENLDFMIKNMTHAEYLTKLLENNVVRLIVPSEIKEAMANAPINPFVDTQSEYDMTDAYLVIMLTPIYWIKSMGKKWE